MASAHEDGSIQLFDFTQMKIVNTLKNAHSDSVSSVTFSPFNTNCVISGGHDGSIRTWDLRKLDNSTSASTALVAEIREAHESKYNEAVQCITAHQTAPLIATGGSDSLVKMFEI
jgi:striatin 1/3/4